MIFVGESDVRVPPPQSIELYRARFKPSKHLEKPYVMLGYNVFAADTDEEAQFVATMLSTPASVGASSASAAA